MPVILRHKGYKLFFFSNEGNPREPVHIHVRKGASLAKFWLNPIVIIENSYGMSSSELKELTNYIELNKTLIERSWHEFFES